MKHVVIAGKAKSNKIAGSLANAINRIRPGLAIRLCSTSPEWYRRIKADDEESKKRLVLDEWRAGLGRFFGR